MSDIFKQIHQANLDKELEVILLKILWYNHSPKVTEPIIQFLQTYEKINEDYWNSFIDSNSFETALDAYYQFSKNKCTATDTLLDHLNLSLNYDTIREEMSMIMRDSFTF